MSSLSGARTSRLPTSDEEDMVDTEEPPEMPLRFVKRSPEDAQYLLSSHRIPPSPHFRKSSLLTQALLTSPELGPLSDIDIPQLTSDGGMTSPARTTTPSPPLPVASHAGLPPLEVKDLTTLHQAQAIPAHADVMPNASAEMSHEKAVEETLGRRRCISFACSKLRTAQAPQGLPSVPEPCEPHQKPALPPKRPCMLRFVCPSKPTRSVPSQNVAHQPPSNENLERAAQDSSMEALHLVEETRSPDDQPVVSSLPPHSGDEPSIDTATAQKETCQIEPVTRTKPFNRINFQRSEATSFYEFASSYHTEDEWSNEQTAYRQKMTISDTLKKENAIRQLAEEADQDILDETAIPDDDDEDDEDPTDQISDDGNESDDEGGFADSDDESDAGYGFWTPGLTTAATSTDHMEQFRPLQQHRIASESSINSFVSQDRSNSPEGVQVKAAQHSRRRDHGSVSAPKLMPDSSKRDDFIIGTLDEDRPLEDAYLSSLEKRKRSKYRLIPQDIDPSFPTSDPEVDDDVNDSEDEDEDEDDIPSITARSHTPKRAAKPAIRSCYAHRHKSKSPDEHEDKTPVPSGRRLQSPPPRRLFGQTAHRLRSPPPQHRRLASPPSSRRPSVIGSPMLKAHGMMMPHLAQRPNLTHTTSLPRTPNPFWDLHRKGKAKAPSISSAGTSPPPQSQASADLHTRGPIDIVQGLENKKQRRKEKFWRIYCHKAHAGKEKERKCHPGKGAERMREVGKEMQDRFKGYGQRTNLMLSI